MFHYHLHGLIVASETPLSAVPCNTPAEHADTPSVHLLPWQSDSELFDHLCAPVHAESMPLIHRNLLDNDGNIESTIRSIAHDHGWRTLFFGEVLFHFDIASEQLQRVTRSPDTVALGEALQVGSYWATLTALRGRTPIHGSAVDMPDGGTWLIVAPSGHGKTSTAASLLLAGAKLRSDDVVTLTQQADLRWGCESGSLSLRMRQAIPAAELAAAPSLRAGDVSGDERYLYSSTDNIPRLETVRGICFPVLDEFAAEVSITPIDLFTGFKQLANDPRVGGVQDRQYQTQRVAQLTALCRALPMLELRLPFLNRQLSSQGAEIARLLQQYGEQGLPA